MLYKLSVFLPFIGFVILGLASLFKLEAVKAKLPVFATVLLGLSCAINSYMFYEYFIGSKASEVLMLANWINASGFSVDFAILLDKLSVLMLFVVSLISFLVHTYSLEYMKEEKGIVRFYSYLGLFTFVMYMLVAAPNLMQLFLGWEGVGVASYLLIGFWYSKDSASAASMKAFIINRIADLALITAMILLFKNLSSLDFAVLLSAESLEVLKQSGELNLIALLLFIGAMGKSAQFGFHTWLPDAMEGPTPVSALIHSATMVSAGVFLVVRMSELYSVSEVMNVIAIVGMVTALFASLVGLAQRDIKKVIAYSTCSQLGYMFFACGIGAYSAAMFHLFTHAFFKALLFLGAGSVIHAAHHQQDMFKLGGLGKLMPFTFILMWVGSLGLLGVPPFSGYFSKDFILEAAFMLHSDIGLWVYIVGTFGAMLTAIYSCRVIFLVFNKPTKLSSEDLAHVHEVKLVMLIPMAILGLGAIFAGYLGFAMTETDFWQGAITQANQKAIENIHHIPFYAKYLPLVLVIIGSLLAYFVIIKAKGVKFLAKFDCVKNVFENKFYIDELYANTFERLFKLTASVSYMFDRCVVDGFVNFVSKVVMKLSKIVRRMQTGLVYDYNFVFLLVLIVALAVFIFKNIY